MFRFVELEQNTPEWHAFRKGKIMASMAPDIMGVGFRTPLQLWEDIIFDKQVEENAAMKRGKELEPEALKWVNKKLGMDFKPAVVQSTENPWLGASLDGYCRVDNQDHIIEIKCPGSGTHQLAVGGEIPMRYEPQLIHQMGVMDVPAMYYVSFDGEDGVIIPYGLKKLEWQHVLHEEKMFKDRIDDFRAPEPSDRDWVQITDSRLEERANRLAEIKAILKDLEREEDRIQQDILKEISNVRCMIGDLKIQKILRKGAIDYGKIEALQDMDLEPYRKGMSAYYKFSCQKK